MFTRYFLFFLLIVCQLTVALSAQSTLEQAESAMQELNYQEAISLYSELLAGQTDPLLELKSRIGLSNAYFGLDTYADAIEQGISAVSLSESVGDPRLQAEAQVVLAKVLDMVGQIEEANALLTTSLNSLRTLDATPSYLQLEALRRLADLNSGIGSYEEGERMFMEALALYEQMPEKRPLELAEIHNRLGVHFSILRQFPTARSHLDTSLAIREELLSPSDERIGNLYLSLGVIARNIGDFEQAKYDLEKSLSIYSAIDPQPVTAGNSYYFLAGIYYYQGDFQTAERYFLASRDIYAAAMGGENAPQLPSIYMALAAIDYEWGKYDEARTYIGRSVAFFKNFNNGQDPTYLQALLTAVQIELAAGQVSAALDLMEEAEAQLLAREEGLAANILSYTALGDAYCEIGLAERGLEILENGIRIYGEQGQARGYLTADVHLDLCKCYRLREDYDRALENLRITAEIQQREFGNRHDGLAMTYGHFAEIHKDLGQLDSALHYAHLSLQAGHQQFAAPDVTEAPDLMGVLSPADYVSQLRRKADLLAMADSEIHNPLAAERHYRIASELVSRLSNTYTSQGARLYFQESLSPVFSGALQNTDNWETEQTDQKGAQAFYYMESGRAGLLTSVLQGVADQPFAGVPDELRRKAASLRAQLAKLEVQVSQARIDTSAAAQAAAEPILNDQLRVQLAYDSLLSLLAADYPDFYALNYEQKVVDLKELQSTLRSGEVLLEYFLARNHLYILGVSATELSWHSAPWDSGLSSAIASLRQPPAAGSFATNPEQATRAFLEQSKLLYDQLIAPVPLLEHAEKLIIIPHGLLNYLSFSSLSATVGDTWSAASFLADRLSIQQDYSSTLWVDGRTDGHRLGNTQLLAVAPDQSIDTEQLAGIRQLNFREELSPLRFSQEEVEAAASYFPGTVLSGADANETAFKESAGAVGILHLAMHALVSDSLPMYSHFLFSQTADSLEDNFLHAYELYQLKLPAEMAVLSACNTGFGRFQSGEGVLSLAHAFRYAGTRSIIMSLWPAEDESTATIIGSFYEQLSTGASKDDALRQAQLAFRAQADPYHAHPYFWSHLVAVGDMRPLKSGGFSGWWWLVAAALGVGVLAVARSRRW